MELAPAPVAVIREPFTVSWAIFINGLQLDATEFAERADAVAAFGTLWADVVAGYDPGDVTVEYRARFETAYRDCLERPASAGSGDDHLAVADIGGVTTIVHREVRTVLPGRPRVQVTVLAGSGPARRQERYVTAYRNPDQ